MSGRRSRTALLIATVALSAGLIAAVSCAMASVHKALEQKVQETVGAADLRVQRVGADTFDRRVMAEVETWPEVRLVVGRLIGAIALENPRTGGADVATLGVGIDPDREYQIRPQSPVEGRPVEALGEIALDTAAAEELRARVGDVLRVQRWGEAIELKLVGIVKRPALGLLSRPESFVTLEQMELIAERPGRLRELDVLLHDPSRAETVAQTRAKELPKGVVVRPTSKITTGLEKNMESSQIGMTIASALAFLSASFIIMTGLTTNVTERLRELAMLRCIGATRSQLAESQLAVGFIVGIVGAVAGVPVGILGAFIIVKAFPEQLPGGFAINPPGLALSVGGAIGAGLLGAAWPAWRAARTTPLDALAIRSRPARVSGILLCVVLGALFAAAHVAVIGMTDNPDFMFWGDVTVGMPALFTGYFLLAVPVMVLVAAGGAPPLSRLFGLPPGILKRTILATPYRFGFTAGAMMTGLALLIAIWTNGRAIQRDWLGSFKFPDAYAAGPLITDRTRERIEALPFVTGTVAITRQNFKTEAFGLRAFDNANTTFLAFEPEPFFEMTRLDWVESIGDDPKEAIRRLEEGGAVLVAREFKVTKGLGVGDTITLRYRGRPHTFDIVGVVSSPGLDIVSKFFDVGEEYLDQAVNAVFGNRKDLERMFGNTGIHLLQIGLDPEVDDTHAVQQIRKVGGYEILSAGSGRQIKEEIHTFLNNSLFVFSTIAVVAMLVACFGVANLIIAGIQARQYEFGVLRAVGAQRGLLTRLVLAEALLIAATACLLGTVMGVQASWAGQRMYQVVLGLLLDVRVPWDATAAGWAVLTAITLLAAGPAAAALARKHPRELLGAVRG